MLWWEKILFIGLFFLFLSFCAGIHTPSEDGDMWIASCADFGC